MGGGSCGCLVLWLSCGCLVLSVLGWSCGCLALSVFGGRGGGGEGSFEALFVAEETTIDFVKAFFPTARQLSLSSVLQ